VNESLQSVLIGTSALSAIAIVALLLTIVRSADNTDATARDKVVRLLLIGISVQCIHFVEEFITRLPDKLPQMLGLRPWSAEFFITLNLFWISLWVLSAVGVRSNFRPTFFPVWFFTIGMAVNGVAHPALAIAARGHFPGLITSPFVATLGIILGLRLWKLTSPQTYNAPSATDSLERP
jgi:hypothetical protein